MRGPGGTAAAPAGHAEPVIRALRVAAAQLDDDGETWLADYLREAADQVCRFVASVSGDEGARVMAELRRVARRNSGLFLGSVFAAGLSLGRRLQPDDVGASRAVSVPGSRPAGAGPTD